jgi:hypothetical protein
MYRTPLLVVLFAALVVPIPPDWQPGENCDAPRTGPCPKPLY